MNLSDRQKKYESSYDYKILDKIPIIIRINGKNFTKLSKNLEKPFSNELFKIMANATMYSITEIQGAIFGYLHHDEITFIIRNDQSHDTESWFNNRIQKINSIAVSTFTMAFYKFLLASDLELFGDPIFDARTFGVPNIAEANNNIIWRQQDCLKSALRSACLFEIGSKIGYKKAFDLIEGKTSEEKKYELLKYSGINFDEFYPKHFIHGASFYKIPILLKNSENSEAKYKWSLNLDTPNFLENKNFLFNILLNGKDIVRADQIL
jgi:tRNA(His) 5'-end guanylyltransferase